MTATPTRFLLDSDTGIDDSLALLHLVERHLSGEVELTGVVCTAGNVCLDDTLRNTLAWLDLVRAPGIAVSAGAAAPTARPHAFTPETHGPHGVGYADLPDPGRESDPRSGAQLWVDLARAHPGRVVGVLTGPASSLAAALKIEPDLPWLLRRLVVMGGTFRGHPGNTTPVSEWNVDVDPEAADAVCQAWDRALDRDTGVVPPTWCGLNLTERALWTPERSAALLDGADTVVTRAVVDALRFYFEFHESVGEEYLAQVHDPLVAWIALHPRAVETIPAHVRVECAGTHTRGMTVADVRGHRRRPANAELAVGLRPPHSPDSVLDAVARSIVALARGGRDSVA